jgi:hypothetical protein
MKAHRLRQSSHEQSSVTSGPQDEIKEVARGGYSAIGRSNRDVDNSIEQVTR